MKKADFLFKTRTEELFAVLLTNWYHSWLSHLSRKPEGFKPSKESKVTWQRRFHIVSLNGNIVVFLCLSKECLILIICFYLLHFTKVLVYSRLEIKTKQACEFVTVRGRRLLTQF